MTEGGIHTEPSYAYLQYYSVLRGAGLLVRVVNLAGMKDDHALKGKFLFLNLNLISGIKNVHLLINDILVKVSVLRMLFR